MNTEILKKYKITFNVLGSPEGKEIQVLSSIIPQISGFLLKCYPEYLLEEVIPEIDKALSGLSYDSDGGGVNSILLIDIPNSTFENIYNPEDHFSIPTTDLREILTSYVGWVSLNNLEEFI